MWAFNPSVLVIRVSVPIVFFFFKVQQIFPLKKFIGRDRCSKDTDSRTDVSLG